ncbi:KH domain-containing protein [Drosera capensis]
MSSSRYMAYSPSPSTAPQSPHILPALRSATSSSAPALSDEEKYIAELFAERQKLSPFQSVLPNCWRLLNQEIFRVTTLLGNAQILDQTGLEHARPMASGGMYSNGRADVNGWNSPYRSEMSGISHHSSPQSWLGSHGLVVKKTMRVDVPVDKYPNYNFVGRLLGPRGNSLKRVEASTDCRVLIRGRGSIKDPAKEEMMRGKPGYEHLNEPLHILVEGELPVDVIDAHLFQARQILEDLLKPVDESQDFFKKQQLRELAMINGTLRDEGAHMSGSVSPFHNSLGMKRAKTQGFGTTGLVVGDTATLRTSAEGGSTHPRGIAPDSVTENDKQHGNATMVFAVALVYDDASDN